MLKLTHSLLILLLVILSSASNSREPVTQYRFNLVERLPHSTTVFTQGLAIDSSAKNGFELWQSSGRYGHSFVEKINPYNLSPLATFSFPKSQFAEGIALLGDYLYGLSWQSGIAYRWHKDNLTVDKTFILKSEGWGLTHWNNQLIMSDGSNKLTWLDPETLNPLKHISVTFNQQPLHNLNDLTVINGRIWANVWQKDYLVEIDANTGKVIGQLDLSSLATENSSGDPEAVLNGLAWDNNNQMLLVTGKNWRYLYLLTINALNVASSHITMDQ
jgi:glutamine cyclotransferase